MRRILSLGASLAACCGLGAAPAVTDDAAEAIAVIHAFTRTLDRDVYQSLCTGDAVIIDHVPPYVFRGPSACRDEWDAVEAWNEQNQLAVTDFGAPTEPEFVDVAGDRVYAVFPVTASGTRLGKAFLEQGRYTFVVRREPEGWRIAAVAWSTTAFTFEK